MANFRYLAIVCCGLLVFRQAQAEVMSSQTHPEKTLPGFQVLMRSVVKNHPLLQARRYSLQGSQSEVLAARLQFLPTPSVSVDSLEGRQANVFRLTQPLYDGGKLSSNVSQANLKESIARMSIEEGVLELASRLSNYYQAYVLQAARIQALNRGIEALETLDALISRRVDVGVSADIDKNLSTVRLIQAKTDLMTAWSLKRSAHEQIVKLTGWQVEASAQESLHHKLPELPANSLEGLQLIATQMHPTVQQLTLQNQLVQVELESLKAELIPVISLKAERQTGDVILGTLNAGNRVYVGAQYSLGAGFSIFPRIQAAQIKVETQGQQQLAYTKELEERLVSDWYEYQSIIRRRKDLESVLDSAVQLTESTKRLFVAGRRSWLDLQNSLREQMQADLSLADAKTSVEMMHLRLLLGSGQMFWAAEQ